MPLRTARGRCSSRKQNGRRGRVAQAERCDHIYRGNRRSGRKDRRQMACSVQCQLHELKSVDFILRKTKTCGAFK